MIRFKWSQDGLWFTRSHKHEQVNHLFRIGSTDYNGMKIYEIIIGKLFIGWRV
jgi:hypothetical protein